MGSGQEKFIIALEVGIAVALAVTILSIVRYRKRQFPTNWRKVGHLSELFLFPIKSCGAVKLDHCACETLGLCAGPFRDRTFMVVNQEKKFLTCRTHPEMARILPRMEECELVLENKDLEECLRIDLSTLKTKKPATASVWDQSVDVIDCGDEAAAWLARVITEGSRLQPRLVFYPQDFPTRPVRPKNTIFGKLKTSDTGALPDATSYNLLSKSSLEDLNSRLLKPVQPLNFRPNFVIEGSKEYEEDTWDWVRIGNAVFRNVKPCTRCILTTVDPITGVKDVTGEPLKALKKYRQLTDPKLRSSVGDAPVMGIHLALRIPGSLKLGDPIYVSVS